MSDAKTEFESVSDCDGRVAELEHEHDSRIDGVSYSEGSTGVWLSVREQCYYVVVSVLMTTFSSDVFASFSILPKRYSYSLKYVPDFIFQNIESTSTAHVKIPMLIDSLVFMIYNWTTCHTYLYQKLFGSPPPPRLAAGCLSRPSLCGKKMWITLFIFIVSIF